MKIQYTKLNFSKLLMLFALNAVLISCGTYQHATIEDGIYANENDTKRKKKVVVVKVPGLKEVELVPVIAV